MTNVLLFGATGLVGNYLLEELLQDDYFNEVKVFSRRPLDRENSKLKEVIDPLNEISSVAREIKGHIVFCCLGTTMRKAGSKEAFKKVDLHIPVQIAQTARDNGISKMIIISSLGADKNSLFFYSRVKGEMEEQVLQTGIPEIYIVRPSLLLGKRNEFRAFEEIWKTLYVTFSYLFVGKLKKYKGIHAKTVAKSMVYLAKKGYKETVIESETLKSLQAK